jgi:hypothetical protein
MLQSRVRAFVEAFDKRNHGVDGSDGERVVDWIVEGGGGRYDTKRKKKKKGDLLDVKQKVRFVCRSVVPRETRSNVLEIVKMNMCGNPLKGKKFRDSYCCDYDPYCDMVAENQLVTNSTASTPDCIVCGVKIRKGEERCKFSLIHLDDHSKSEHCGTHVYHLNCFLAIEGNRLPNMPSVCYGTCLHDRGGCKQVYLQSSEQ